MKKKQIENQAQQGRSMVEMLGVLAIIGVISIGGIAGYRMAMNRYQANQIANEINLMRTDAKVKAAAQVTTGKLMLGEPYDSGHLNLNSHYGVEFDFAVFSEAGEPEESGYYIKVSGVPAGVCKPLVTLLEGMDDVIAVVVNEQENNADSSTDLCTEESNNALEVDFSTKDIGGVSSGSDNPPTDTEQGDEPQDDPVCNDETCAGGECQADGTCKCNDENEYWTGYGCTTCPAGARQEDGTCECTEEGSHLKGSACITCPEEAPWSDAADDCVCKETGKSWSSDGKCIENVCNTNGEGCDDDEYCDMSVSSCRNGNPFPASSGHTCKKAEENYTTVEVENSEGGKKTIYKSNSTMNWWAADAFCQALGRKLGKSGMHLVSLEGDLGCTYANNCKEGSYGKSLADQLKIGNRGWTSTLYSSKCLAYSVNLNGGHVFIGNRYDTIFALCE